MDVKIGELEDLFERYRSGQDLRALSKLFDLAAPELLRLAVHMAPDVACAEDLVQQTFLVAIEKPKRWRAGEPLLPWLFGILSKLAKKQRRSMRRSPEPDRLAPRSAEDPARRALDAETQSAIRGALERLPELYREVVRASLFDEKPPHEIARELERAPGTVRMQLLRGLEMLRRALPAGLAGGALVLCGTRGEAALKAVVLEKAAAPVVLATSAFTLGGLLVSTKAVLVLLVAVVGLCAWLLWPRVEPQGIVAQSHESTIAPVLVASREQDRPQIEPVATAERAEVTPAEANQAAGAGPAGGVYLVGKVLGVAPGFIAEVELHVTLPRGRLDAKPTPDGKFEIDLASIGTQPHGEGGSLGSLVAATLPKPVPGETTQVEIWARHARYISQREIVVATDLFAPLSPGERREIRRDFQMRPAAIVSGRVRVPSGWRVEDADVHLGDSDLQPDFLDEVRAFEHSGCDAEGRYTIKSMRHGELLVRADLSGLLPVAVKVRVEPGTVLELPELVLEESTCAIRGRLDLPSKLLDAGDAQARPFFIDGFEHGIQICAQRLDAGGSSAATGALEGRVLDMQSARAERELRGGCVVSRQRCTVAGDRSFALRGLEPGKWELTIEGIQDNGTLPLLEKTIVDAPAEGIVLGEQLGSIAIAVLDSKGPVRGAAVTVGDGETFSTFTNNDDSPILLLGDLRKDYTASAGAPGRDKASIALPAAGRAREASFELRLSDAPPCATLVFHPADRARAPKAVQVHLDPGEGNDLGGRNERIALTKGNYVLGGVLPGHWKITVGPTEEQIPVAFYGGYLQSEHFDFQLAPGERWERTLRCEIGGRLRIAIEADAGLKSNGIGCTLLSLEGRAVDAPIFVSCVSGEGFGMFSGSEHLKITGEHTQIALQDCLPTGRYELRIPSDKVRAKPLQFEIKAGETTQASWKIEK